MDAATETRELVALAARVIEQAAERGASIATAESCTGGLVAHLLTEVPGASQVFLGGFVLYANSLKSSVLSVPVELFEQPGAVSEPVALHLARSARERSGADVVVATTGIAGPGGGTAEKPVGLLWHAVATDTGSHAARVVVAPRPRDAMKRAFAAHALKALLARL
jgi:PncC family amidohydrolase